MKLHLSLVSVLLLSACDTQPAPYDSFLGLADAGSDATTSDAFGAVNDAPSAAGTSIAMTYRTRMGTFDRAFIGYVRTGDAITGLYFELSRGADAACPSETSPVPQQIITVDGFSPAAPSAQTTGITVRFFDFEGSFRDEVPPDAPTMSRVEVTALDTTAGTAEGNVMFTFADGTASGSFRATHCDSLDATN